MKTLRFHYMAAVTAIAIYQMASLAHAQNTSGADNATIGDIIVTAQKREERLQDVPISINAITASDALEAGIKTTTDLSIAAPAVNIVRITQAPIVYIRGVGTDNGAAGEEGSNPIYLDGFYNPSIAGSYFSLNNIERIEVLKGPQGTLFGRNSTGGAINVITRMPSHTATAKLSLGYGNYDTVEASAYASGSLTSTIAADIALYSIQQHDGWGKNLANGRDVFRQNEKAVRTKFLIEPSTSTRITIAGDYSVNRSDTGIPWQSIPGAFTPVVLQGYSGTPYVITNNLQPKNNVWQWGINGRIEQSLGGLELVSMTSYRKLRADYEFDQDASGFSLVNAFFHSGTRSFTQELQLQSSSTSPIQWIVGAFYLNTTTDADPLLLTGAAFARVGFSDERFGSVATKSLAGYAQATIPLGEKTDITAGIRYTHDKKSARFEENFGNGVSIDWPDKHGSWSELTWRGAVSHRFSEVINVFASVSKGYKSGQISIVNPANDIIDPETLIAYEAGFKSDLFDRHVRLNASVFHYRYKDIQLQTIIQGTQFLLNAAKAQVTGLDTDLIVSPSSRLSITASGSYLFKHEYTDFPNAPGKVRYPLPPLCNPAIPVTGPCGGNSTVTIANAAGNKMIRSPRFQGSINASYEIPLDDNSLTIGGTAVYNSGFFWEPDNRIRQERYTILNGNLTYKFADDSMRLRFWGRNLTNKHYAIFFSSSVSDSASPAAPRTYGLTFEAAIK
ncbi:TonB-dependent receptor [Sphingobium sp. JS3065]|uniref:TonB-dependent receptor n=1 Tax=Sphingobium sp. JS3065 TaxID=2970925 RepID=UPI0022645A83|nr:TonB-dependent receptor [Sphingobium sp. JS3065]UZW57531.1 TonB-dependent receptor [Sphingobium sp. JS3065]